MSQNSHILRFAFVDDIVVIYEARHTEKAGNFQTRLFQRYEMRYLGEF